MRRLLCIGDEMGPLIFFCVSYLEVWRLTFFYNPVDWGNISDGVWETVLFSSGLRCPWCGLLEKLFCILVLLSQTVLLD
jgi:hypothetical protein